MTMVLRKQLIHLDVRACKHAVSRVFQEGSFQLDRSQSSGRSPLLPITLLILERDVVECTQPMRLTVLTIDLSMDLL